MKLPRLALIALAAVLALAAGLYLSGALTRGKAAQVQARLEAGRADAALAAASDAVNTVATVGASDAAADQITKENADAIHKADGAAAPVHPAVRDAGLAGLCRRAAYRGSVKCLRFTPAADVAGAGARR